MNYLSHYYFDQENTDPYYILGIALPDLSKNHHRRWNIHPQKHLESYTNNPHLLSIYKGWQRHLHIDHHFHESEYFNKNSHLITERIRTIPLENKVVKPFMLGHIGLELVLDTLLIKNNKLEVDSFYEKLNACNLDHIIDFLEINEVSNAVAFREFYNRFCEVKYLMSYKSNESIVYALNRIQYRITGQYFTENDTRLMHHHIAELMDIIEHDYLSIFEELQLIK